MAPEREHPATNGDASGSPPTVARRDFLGKAATATLAGAALASTHVRAQDAADTGERTFDPAMEAGESDAVTGMRRDVQRSLGKPARERRWGMVIDLHKCVGCSGCDIACKRENNVPHSFAWSNHMLETRGTFPDTQWRYIPTMCNHCSDAPCVANCPTTAMHKTEDGLTMHDVDKCIGCRACQVACPYGAIYYNKHEPHADVLYQRPPRDPGRDQHRATRSPKRPACRCPSTTRRAKRRCPAFGRRASSRSARCATTGSSRATFRRASRRAPPTPGSSAT